MVIVWNGELWWVMVFLDYKVCKFVDLNPWFSRLSKKMLLKHKKVLEWVGLEPATLGLRVWRSIDWAVKPNWFQSQKFQGSFVYRLIKNDLKFRLLMTSATVYWEDGFWGWPEDREPVWGWKQPSEGPHYTWEQLECHDCSQGRGGPGFSGGRRKSNLLSSAQSVVLTYSCYCGVRIWTGLGGRNVCSVPRFSAWKGVLLTPAPDVRQNP